MTKIFLWAAALAVSSTLLGGAQDHGWTYFGNETDNPVSSIDPSIYPEHYSLFTLDDDARARMFHIDGPSTRGKTRLPSPDGTINSYIFWDSAVMSPELAEKNPDIATYQGFNEDEEQLSVRFDNMPSGIHGQGYAKGGLFYISPLIGKIYIIYYARDYRPNHDFGCDVGDGDVIGKDFFNAPVTPKVNYGTTKQTYRLAISATAEYTTASGGAATALSSLVTATNFMNGVYEVEAGIKFQLIANNANIIYTNAATDPFTPEAGKNSMLSQNQTSTDLTIGAANYDIGHVVHNLTGTGNTGSGVATLTATCRANLKARGVTTASRIGQTPMNPFFYRVLIHEVGHQFGANHSFNSSCSSNRNDATAYEPGGGSTIMSYAGGCSPYNVQTYADTYFHRISLEEIATYKAGLGGTCGTVENTGNAIPTADAGASYIIPRSTPFILTGTASDANANSLTYSWEQYNKEIATAPPVATSTGGPNFRSMVPTTSPQRYFPRLSDVVSNLPITWEVLPSVARTLNFSLVVRDNVGGVVSDDTVVTVNDASGPFAVTSPNGSEVRRGAITVTWNVANTNAAPVSTSLVDILLSTNNGLTFTTVLADNTPNDGNQLVTLPAITSAQARIMIRAEGNIYYDISNGPFIIQP